MNKAQRRRSPLLIAALAAIIASLFVGATVTAAEPTLPGEPATFGPAYVGTISTTTTLAVEPAESLPGASVTLTATVAPDPGCGSVRFTYNGASVDVAVGGGGEAGTTVTSVAGTLVARAEFLGCGEYSSSIGTANVVARHASTTSITANPTTAVRFEEPVTLTATVTGPATPSGTVTFQRLDGGNPVNLGSAPVSGGIAKLVTGSLPVGTVDVLASYSGNTVLKPSVSGTVTVTITPDMSVKATDVGVQWARVYPVKDGYRDTDAIRGRTLEPATVTIRIHNAGGSRVGYWALGTKNGSYSVTWTGRTSSGTLLPAGTYSVKQTIQDQAGNTMVVTDEVVLSHKKLVWIVDSQTRYASSGAFFVSGYADTYKSRRHSKGMVLDGGYFAEDSARARYTFTLPEAATYSSIRVSVYGRSVSPYSKGFMRFYDWSDGGWEGKASIGYSTGWYESSEPATGLVNAERKVQAWVWAPGSGFSVVDYWKVRLTYKYAVLR